MAASDHVSPDQFFHGTTHDFEPGQVLDPSEKRGRFWFAGTMEEPTSGNYGDKVYAVQPLGEYEDDPALKHIPELKSYVTTKPVKVLKRVR